MPDSTSEAGRSPATSQCAISPPEPERRNLKQDVWLLQLSKGWVLLITSIQEWMWLPQLNEIKLLSIPRLRLEDKEEHL